MKYPVVSIFSGAMGLDLGLEKAGLDVRIAQDFDPWCVETVRQNRRPIVGGDIRQLLADDPDCTFLLEPSRLKPGDVFAVVGGPPCQPFSTAGKRLSTEDPRGSLFTQYCQVVDSVRPRFFVLENVKGLISACIHRRYGDCPSNESDSQAGSVLESLLDSLSVLGYSMKYGLLDAAHYGVPEFRERLVIIGSRDQESIFLPMPTHFQIHQEKAHRWRTLRWAIEDIEDEPGPYAQFSADRLAILNMVPMGGNWRDLPKNLQESAMGGAFRSGGGKVGFYRRLNYDEPCPTLVTSPVQKATMFCHPTRSRPLSVREYARIQGFPDEWHISGPLNACYRQIGNAVPVGLGEAIGKTLVAIAAGNATVVTKRNRGTSVHGSAHHLQVVTHLGEGARNAQDREQ